MPRDAASFNRAKPSEAPQPTVLVICEDSKSGKVYIEDAALYYRANVKVSVVHIGKTDPKNIVAEAIKKRSKFDKVYCVVDRDSHEGWDEAVRLAEDSNGVEFIASYPCFEFWLILHFGVSTKPYVKSGAKSPGECCAADLKKCKSMEKYKKGGDARLFEKLLDRLGDAKKNSKRIYDDATRLGSMNPSTKMHVIIGDIEELGDDF
ncbi:RloB family protein [Burkholderia sp. A1]|uniref:RloB family protein n=1 Tax=Burkholderia sp. A1 TaxID=148446 RepID=UPI00137755CD|nr:RloB family protein [Burkholderia sp. A1]